MPPYRSSSEEKPAEAPRTGLVADMVRQFADPYAFLRELVQNGIDAGASTISVRVARDDGDLAITTVTDDGCGMTPEIMEGPLLTLFSSSKEGDLSKIGKYGVGFVSVFALEPDEVQVTTWRDGKAYLLRLFLDHRYTIEEAPTRSGSGTSVAVLKRMDTVQFIAHSAAVGEALQRWCRHAERPIEIRISGITGDAHPTVARVDVPFTVAAPVTVTAIVDDETFVVGPSAGAHLLAPAEGSSPADLERNETFAGFYNRGLTLFETAEALHPDLRGIRFKVKSPHLSHTLSRDNVRRDEAFARVISKARDLARGDLPRALKAEIARAATAAAGGARVTEYGALLEAAMARPTELRPGEIAFPLTDPIRGAMALSDLGSTPLYDDAPSAITEALARADRPVVRLVHPAVFTAVQRSTPRFVDRARRAFLLVAELPKGAQGEVDRALGDELKRVIAAAGEAVGRVALGSFEGDAALRTAVVVPDEDPPSPSPRLWAVAEIEAMWRRWSGKYRLILSRESAWVRSARALAASDVALAAHLLGRALLVEGRGPLDPAENARILELAGEAVVAGPRGAR